MFRHNNEPSFSETIEESSIPRSQGEGIKRWLIEIDTNNIPPEYKEQIDSYLVAINKHPALSNIKRQDIPYFLNVIRFIRQLISSKRPAMLKRAITELSFLAYELDLTRGVDFAWTKTTEAENRRVEMRESSTMSKIGRLFGSRGE